MTATGEDAVRVDDAWAPTYAAAERALNTPSGKVTLPALRVMRLVRALRKAEELAERNGLLYIEASNPGIDMDEVRRIRSEGTRR